MELSILIVTYNSARHIRALLQTLRSETRGLQCEIVLVDNASSDDTLAQVSAADVPVRVVASSVNLGFAAGNNLAADRARGKYLLLLNPDAFPQPGSIYRALRFLRINKDVGLLGGELLDARGQHQPSGRMFPTLRDELFTLSGLAAKFPNNRLFGRLDRRWADQQHPALVDWIPGAFVFMPRQLFLRLGAFDERFFMYYEEVDLCHRLRLAGYKVMYWPELKAMHEGGASAQTVVSARVSKSGKQLERYRMRSALLYYRKWHGALAAALWRGLEDGWYRLRAFKAGLLGRQARALEWQAHCIELRQAWTDTSGGKRCPPRPW